MTRGRGARSVGARRVREPVPRAEGRHRVPARYRRLRDAVPRPEPDHERHALVRARRRQAVVSTPYLHAEEALADDRGLLVDFRSADEIAEAVSSLLADPKQKGRSRSNAYAYANEATWPKTVSEVPADVAGGDRRRARPRAQEGRAEPRPRPDRRASPANPLITPRDVAPSQEGFEVISTINPGVTKLGEETIMLVRDRRATAPTTRSAPRRRDGRPRRRRAEAGATPRPDLARAADRHGVLRHVERPAEGPDRLRPTRSARARPVGPADDPLSQHRRGRSPRETRSSPTTSRTSHTYAWRAARTVCSSRSTRIRRSCRPRGSRSTGSRTRGSR